MLELLNKIADWFLNETSIYIKGLTLPFIIIIGYKFSNFIINKIQVYKDSSSLFPYYEKSVLKKAKKDFIRTKCQNIDPSNETNLESSFAFSTKEDLLKFFLKKVFKQKNNLNQFYLILGDSGMGKTTFALNLFSKYNSFVKQVFRNYKIKLLPLGISFDSLKIAIENIPNPDKTILVLDGFDESPNINDDEIQEEFNKLIDLVQKFRIVIFTCRTHYFSSQKDEPNELKIKKFNTNGNGYHHIKKMYVSPFDKKDIKKYINKRFSFIEFTKKVKAHKIIKNTDDLLARPMLLSYIDDLVSSKKNSYETRTDIYEVLILSWLNRESNKYPEDKRYTFRSNLAFFSYELTRYVYENYEVNGLFIPFDKVEKLSQEWEINLNKIELKSRSLLNRNAQGDYKFSHKSIFEFFLAYLTYVTRNTNKEDFKKTDKERNHIIKLEFDIQQFDQSLLFFEEMVNSVKLEFRLPEILEQYEKSNTKLVREILKEKNKLNQNKDKKIEWITDITYKLR